MTKIARTITASALLITPWCVPPTASAAGPIALEGWVSTPMLRDPLPFPNAHYSGWVDDAGVLNVRADCVKGGLAGPAAPCVTTDQYWGIDDRVLNWQNLTNATSGSVPAAWDGSFVVDVGRGLVNVQVLKPWKGVGMAVGSYTS